MAFVPPKDRVKELSTSNSQTVFAVTGAVDTSYNAFSASMAISDVTIGAVVEPGVAFKVGYLTYSNTNEVTVSTTLANKGTFSAGGSKQVFMGLPASLDEVLNPSAASTATAAGTTTLTVTSARKQIFTGVTTQTVALPVTSTLPLWKDYEIINDSTGSVTVNSSGGNAVTVVQAGGRAVITCISLAGTTAASWSFKANYQIGVATGTSVNLNGATVTNPGEIWSTNSVNNLLSWKLTNTSTGTAASTAVTVGNSAGTMDLSVWSTTFSNAFFTNMAGLIVGSNNAGMLLTTVGAAHPIVFGVNNVENARFDGSTFTSAVTVKTPQGSAVTPGLTVGTAGYGLYQPAANQFGFALAGADLWNYGVTTSNQFFFGGPMVVGHFIKSTFATGGIGYATGAGGAVTQLTSRTTGVTLNKVSGAITLFSQVNSAVSAATAQSFTVTNSAVAANDVVHVTQQSGTDKYMVFVTNTAAGSFQITCFTTGGTTNEAPVFNFVVIKGVNS